ncbi:MAG: hypothetical protein IH609_01445 [Dehalococcoidia bacterium]|nr:hypothetical protein [Dehalococcoidia bacterium]
MTDAEFPRKDVVIQGEPGLATAAGLAGTVLISTAFWRYWLDIAIAELDRAVNARNLGLAARAAGDEVGNAIRSETNASLVATVAAAACVESFSKTIAARAAMNFGSLGKTSKATSAVLSTVFDVDPKGLEDRLRRLFDDRNEAIHSAETDDPTVPHPLGVSTGKGNAFFTVERAAEAVTLAAQLLNECANAPKPNPHNSVVNSRLEGHRASLAERASAVQAIIGRIGQQ